MDRGLALGSGANSSALKLNFCSAEINTNRRLSVKWFVHYKFAKSDGDITTFYNASACK
jgi:hypothetical protein